MKGYGASEEQRETQFWMRREREAATWLEADEKEDKADCVAPKCGK